MKSKLESPKKEDESMTTESEYVTPGTLGVAIGRIYDVAGSIAQKGDVKVVVNVGGADARQDKLIGSCG